MEFPSHLPVDEVLFCLLESSEFWLCLCLAASSWLGSGWSISSPISLSIPPSSLLPPLFFFLFQPFCYLTHLRWNFWSSWFFVDASLTLVTWVGGAAYLMLFSSPASLLRRIQMESSEGVKGFLANCRDFLPSFCLKLCKQNSPEPWNMVFHKCLVKNTFY